MTRLHPGHLEKLPRMTNPKFTFACPRCLTRKPFHVVLEAERLPALVEYIYGACDHDTDTKLKIVPSVVLDVELPDTIDGSWVNGQVYVNYHCATFDKSDAYRHFMLRWLELRLSVKQLKMEFITNWPPKAVGFF